MVSKQHFTKYTPGAETPGCKENLRETSAEGVKMLYLKITYLNNKKS
jgi:hypothetical protein